MTTSSPSRTTTGGIQVAAQPGAVRPPVTCSSRARCSTVNRSSSRVRMPPSGMCSRREAYHRSAVAGTDAGSLRYCASACSISAEYAASCPRTSWMLRVTPSPAMLSTASGVRLWPARAIWS
ncbi:hypothetical protein MB27_21880 [Actinoplanes utahensis]|uniref:Uncharacterized protein n=1 Tax=Actinoplanes utahensis TaxID=1869 RepID=A0A0A6X6B4_ACTUT|nr:hypothetical protein MB27_21880 [Actinoplanes utahensis]